MESHKILIFGGYGTVGRVVSTKLAERFPGQVIVAGRNFEKAKRLAETTDGKIIPLGQDASTAHETPDVLDGVKLVIMLLDLPDVRLVDKCFQKGIHYIDITASYEFMTKVERLDDLAKTRGSTAVLSVGLAPGLTNLLARYAQTQFNPLEHLDIHILLGLGEAHGEAAVRWTVESLGTDFNVLEDGMEKHVHSFSDGKQTVFPDPFGQHTTYRFNMPDQHVLPYTSGISSVSTRLTFDSRWMTKLVALLKKCGFFYLLRYEWIARALVKLMMSLRFGTEQFILQVDGYGSINNEKKIASFSIAGKCESRFTGLVAVQIAEKLMTTTYPPGVFHIEQLFELLPVIEPLTADGLNFQCSYGVGVTAN